MTAPQLIITPQRSALLAGHDNELDVLVRVQAPPAPEKQPERRPINLSLVIDRSGSMSGRPLAEAKRCAEMIIDSLDSDDMVSLVTYDSETRIRIAFRKVGDRNGLHHAVRAIGSGGTTALYDGWYESAGQALNGVEQASVSRVLLLSDGQANVGLTDPSDISTRCAQMAEVGVSTSTYGLGHHFNEELMVQMARAGNGNSYYGQTAEDLMDPFREEFELLHCLCARKLRLQISTGEGNHASLLNGYTEDDSGRWRLPDLAYGGEAWATIRLRVPKEMEQQRSAADASPLFEVILAYEGLDGQSHRLREKLTALAWLSPEAYGAVASDPIVIERAGELHAADLQEKARLAAYNGDWNLVETLLAQAEEGAANNPWLKSIVKALRGYAARRETASLSKEAMYASLRIRSRLADVSENAGRYDTGIESEKARYLRRKREQGKRF